MKPVSLLIVLIASVCVAQTNAKALKVVQHKSDWKVYRSGIEIPKSHFFRIVNDEYNRDQSILHEKEFMTKRFKLSCFMCGNSSLGLLSLASDNQQMVRYTIFGYLVTNLIKRFLKVKAVDVSFEEAQDLARDYNDGLIGQAKIAI
jgi:hypothetical protein